jgi:hypothetical protein
MNVCHACATGSVGSQVGPNDPAYDRSRQQGPAVFWANGNALYGPGRSLYSSRYGSLMVRAACAKPSDATAERARKLPRFTEDLAEVAAMLSLRVSAYHCEYEWPLSIEQICSLARFDAGRDRLLMAHVLAGPDELYLRHWASYFVACDGHPWSNQGTARYLDSGGAEAEELFLRLRRPGLAQRHLARVLNISAGLITKLKQNERRWSSTLLRQAATFIAAAEGHVMGLW